MRLGEVLPGFGKSTVIAPTAVEPVEISEDEKNNIAELMKKLGL